MPAWGDVRSAHELRTHQELALREIATALAAGRRRCWVVLPPGAGKTLVGLLTAADLGAGDRVRRAVVFSPNTAIQAQWQSGWDALLASELAHVDPGPAGTDRVLEEFFTALTYQSLATFDPEAEADDDGLGGATLLSRLHANGVALVEQLQQADHLLLILDECHHLLEMWGSLLAELLELLPNATVLGLTATPPTALTRTQKELVDGLFGPVVASVSMAAGVREGYLAPYAELAWLTEPTPQEAEWLDGQAQRFRDLIAALADPGFGEVGFLNWLDQRFVSSIGTTLSWQSLSSREPELADAALRVHFDGLLAAPPGAVLQERHRHPPTADDWVLLIDDWLAKSASGHDEEVVAAVRRALPSVGFQWTRRGIRRGRSTVDRVLARSEAKTVAAVQIVAAESMNLGERLRMVILCDHECAGATLPADLTGVLDQQSGSAALMLTHLLEDPVGAGLGPVLVTGSTVAGGYDTMLALRNFVAADCESLDLQLGARADGSFTLTGRWTSRLWVREVTRFFTAGHCRVLIGTRGLLGEGWDAPAVSGLIDLTTATTLTAVTQTRGRAIRSAPGWPDKVALTWSIVCVAPEHPRGDNDWQRLVRKHEGFLGINEQGDVIDGVGHLDPGFSPYAPPAARAFDENNAKMLVRAEDRAGVRARWQVGAPYDDRMGDLVRIRQARAASVVQGVLPGPSGLVEGSRLALRPDDLEPRGAGVQRVTVKTNLVIAAASGLLVGGLGTALLAPPVLALVFALLMLVQHAIRGRQLRRLAQERPSIAQVAAVVAQTMHELGESSVGAEAVRVQVGADGEYRCRLDDVDELTSSAFATALAEALAPVAEPRYLLPRGVLDEPGHGIDGLRADLRMSWRNQPDAVLWHPVPSGFGRTVARARAYARVWDRIIGGGPPLYTGSPEGSGVLAGCRGSDAFAVTSALRKTWR